MIKIEFDISDVDYNSIIDMYLPMILENLKTSGSAFGSLVSGGMPAALVKGVLKNLPDAKKEQLLIELINSNAAAASEQIGEYIKRQGTQARISGIRATRK